MAKYCALLRPHANSRYQAETVKLARAELTALLEKGGCRAEARRETRSGCDWLAFEAAPLNPAQVALIGFAAHLYVLFEETEDGALRPLFGQSEAYLGGDLPLVLKYKGKTNETFTSFLLNLAFCASNYEAEDGLTVLDPMCGRGTTAFIALNRGWNALGFDQDAAAVDEGVKYFRKYLEYHRLKHTLTEKSMTANGRQAAVLRAFQFAQTPEQFKRGDTRALTMAAIPAANLKQVYKKPCCQLIVSDLPYGVQHAPGGGRKAPSLEDMLYEALPVWVDLLHTGGAMALSFNVNTLRPEMVRGMMAEAGLDIMDGAAYEGLEHWVEQAITRDVAVAVRRF
ncbi:MAG: hypothetical protein IKO07_08550 [Clostridia bacterium]|nr:hypothetical protein [Clostridia bacterium]